MPYTPSNDWYYGMYGQNASNQLLGQGGNLANMISQYGGGNQYSTYNPSGLNYYTPIQNQNTSVYYKPTTQQSTGSQTTSNIVPLVNQPTNTPSTVPAYNNTNQGSPISITLKSGRVIPIPPSPGGLVPSIGTMPNGATVNYNGYYPSFNAANSTGITEEYYNSLTPAQLERFNNFSLGSGTPKPGSKEFFNYWKDISDPNKLSDLLWQINGIS